MRSQLWTPAPSLPRHATLWHEHSTAIAGSPVAVFGISAQAYAHVARQYPQALNDEFWTCWFLLSAGSYQLDLLVNTGTNRGRLDLYLDDNPTPIIEGIDFYAASGAANVKLPAVPTVIDIPISGQHRLRGVVSGKHASSSGYDAPITRFTLRPAT